MPGSEMREAAIGYAERHGFAVFVTPYGQKDPYEKSHGFKDATSDPLGIISLFSIKPESNIAISCGAPSGNVIIIDVDNKHGKDGSGVLRDWEIEHGDLPETVTCCTPTGGYHYYYRVDREVRPSTNEELGVDIRGDGSYAMLPPSLHPDTQTEYVWEFDPDEHEIADADENVYAFIESVRKEPAGVDGERLEVLTQGMCEGGRNDYLFKLGCKLQAQSWDDDLVAATIEGYNASKCRPPLPADEVRKIIGSVLSKPKGHSEEYEKSLATGGGSKAAKHVTTAKTILSKYNACYLDGAPAIFDGLSYRVGWSEVERTVLREWPNSKDRDRKEVIKYLDLVMPRETQSPPNFIGFKNGVLDIDTMELLSFSPDFRIPNVIPHDWNPDAQSELLDGMFRRVACNDPFIESNLCEFLGLCMYRSGKYAFAAVLLGQQSKTASNGKSTYIDMIRNVLGEDNYSSLSLRALGDRFNQQYLSGKLANLGDDISSEFTDGSSLEVFKKAVSGSKISTDVKNSRGYEFTPYCTMVFSANKFPKMEKLDDGTLRRLFPIRFNAHFTKEDPDFDPDIGEKLRSEECAEAAIVRGIWGLRRVIEKRGPTDNDESRQMLRDIETDNSTILQWIEDEFVEREWLWERETRDAYRRYDKWCQESGVRKPYGKNQFTSDICSKFGFKVKCTRRNSQPVRIFADL